LRFGRSEDLLQAPALREAEADHDLRRVGLSPRRASSAPSSRKGAPVDYHRRSDFGFAFSRFTKTELDSLDRKTTIVTLGDAGNNYNDPQAGALRLIPERVKGIIRLAPEGHWGAFSSPSATFPVFE
jgi:hypothetical protein